MAERSRLVESERTQLMPRVVSEPRRAANCLRREVYVFAFLCVLFSCAPDSRSASSHLSDSELQVMYAAVPGLDASVCEGTTLYVGRVTATVDATTIRAAISESSDMYHELLEALPIHASHRTDLSAHIGPCATAVPADTAIGGGPGSYNLVVLSRPIVSSDGMHGALAIQSYCFHAECGQFSIRLFERRGTTWTEVQEVALISY